MSLQSSWECLNMWTRKKKKDLFKNSYSVCYPTFHPCHQNLKLRSNWELTDFIQRCGELTLPITHRPSDGQLNNTMKNSNTWMMKSEETEFPANRKNDLYFFLGNLHSPFAPQRYAHLVSSHTREQTLNESNDRWCKAGIMIFISSFWPGSEVLFDMFETFL